jgi:hypothetical protein
MTRTRTYVTLESGALYQTTAVIGGYLEEPAKTHNNGGTPSFYIEEKIPEQAILLALKMSTCPENAVKIMKNMFHLDIDSGFGWLCLWEKRVIWISQHDLSRKLKLLEK